MPYVYDSDFMDYTNESSRYSATKTIAALSKSIPMRSVLDVGCARGTWLKAWSDAGVGDFFGVDGDYIDTANLNISRDRFLATDLSKPFDLRRTFELVQSLEVAEHIPHQSADGFVENLVRHSDGIIFFSAAPPGQGGEFHVNEQPYDYWRQKFRGHGYAPYDYIRPLLAGDKAVSFWYRFNPLLYITDKRARDLPNEVRVARIDDREEIVDVSPSWFKARKKIVRSLPFGVQQVLARLKARAMVSR